MRSRLPWHGSAAPSGEKILPCCPRPPLAHRLRSGSQGIGSSRAWFGAAARQSTRRSQQRKQSPQRPGQLWARSGRRARGTRDEASLRLSGRAGLPWKHPGRPLSCVEPNSHLRDLATLRKAGLGDCIFGGERASEWFPPLLVSGAQYSESENLNVRSKFWTLNIVMTPKVLPPSRCVVRPSSQCCSTWKPALEGSWAWSFGIAAILQPGRQGFWERPQRAGSQGGSQAGPGGGRVRGNPNSQICTFWTTPSIGPSPHGIGVRLLQAMGRGSHRAGQTLLGRPPLWCMEANPIGALHLQGPICTEMP